MTIFTSSGTFIFIGAKFQIPFILALTNLSATDWANCAGTAITPMSIFNLATTLLKQRSGENNPQDSVLTQQAAKLFGDVATAQSASKQLKQKSFYDLGRLAYDTEDYQSSVDFFKESLRINPADDQARKNLRMAQKKLQENQSNQQQQQDKDQNKDQDKQQDQQQQNQPQANPPKQDKPQLQNTTPDNILNAVQNEEKNTRDKVNKRKAQQMQGRPRSQKPW